MYAFVVNTAICAVNTKVAVFIGPEVRHCDPLIEFHGGIL